MVYFHELILFWQMIDGITDCNTSSVSYVKKTSRSCGLTILPERVCNGAVWLGAGCIGVSILVHGNLDGSVISSLSWTAWSSAVLVKVACLCTFEGDFTSALTRADLLRRNVPFSVSLTKERGCWVFPRIFPRRSWSRIHTKSPFVTSGVTLFNVAS